jgi:PhnB protein
MANDERDDRAFLSPLIAVRNGDRAVNFYARAFGAREVFRVEGRNRELMARLMIGGSELWVADESPRDQNFSPATLGGSSTRLILVVDDPPTTFERACGEGALAISPVVERRGWRVGRLVDPFGHHWEIGHPLGASAKQSK